MKSTLQFVTQLTSNPIDVSRTEAAPFLYRQRPPKCPFDTAFEVLCSRGPVSTSRRKFLLPNIFRNGTLIHAWVFGAFLDTPTGELHIRHLVARLTSNRVDVSPRESGVRTLVLAFPSRLGAKEGIGRRTNELARRASLFSHNQIEKEHRPPGRSSHAAPPRLACIILLCSSQKGAGRKRISGIF
jgi:hypothetical protein